MSDPGQAVQSVRYDDQWAWASLDGEWGDGDYPESMTCALAEAFSVLEGWAVPLAAAFVFRPIEDRTDRSTLATMLLAEEFDDSIELESGWQAWSEPKYVEQITGDVVCALIHERLRSLQAMHGRAHELYGLRLMAWRYAIGPDSLPEEFLLDEGYGTGVRSVRTTTADGKRWISEPQPGGSTLLLPVGIEITRTGWSEHSLEFSMDPNWSYFGDKDSPGWPTIVAAAERLAALSDRWSIAELEPGNPETRPRGS